MIVTAGPTFEAIDTVRGITNLSSGKMGYAIADAAAALGAEVTLISGPTALTPPSQVHFVYVTSAAEMATAVKAHVGRRDTSSASPQWPTTPRSRAPAAS